MLKHIIQYSDLCSMYSVAKLLWEYRQGTSNFESPLLRCEVLFSLYFLMDGRGQTQLHTGTNMYVPVEAGDCREHGHLHETTPKSEKLRMSL